MQTVKKKIEIYISAWTKKDSITWLTSKAVAKISSATRELPSRALG
jgi:hypothetical protein